MEKARGMRLKAGLTQHDAAKLLGVERTTIAKWETGAASPRMDMLPEIARAYGCSVGALFGEEAAQKRKIRIVIEYDPDSDEWSMTVDH